jgi:hypothetical protein
MTSNAAVVAETPQPPSPTRKKIPRPWLDRLRTPLSFKEQKPDVIWEDEDDDASPAIDLLAPPKQLGLLESFQQLWQGFCVPKTSHAPTQHRTTQSAPPVMAIWMESFGAATATTAAPFNVSPAAPTVIYIMHSPASSPMTPGHKTTATTTTWHQQYVSLPYNGGASGVPPTVTVRRCSVQIAVVVILIVVLVAICSSVPTELRIGFRTRLLTYLPTHSQICSSHRHHHHPLTSLP